MVLLRLLQRRTALESAMRAIPAVLLGLSASIAAQAPQTPPDLILLNGKVFTADPTKPSAEAIAIRRDQIIATSVPRAWRAAYPKQRAGG